MDDSELPTQKKTIKHIVISGGGPVGFPFYGALKELSQRKIWEIENIETMHGISIGSILIVFLSLKYKWDVFDDFIIKRPWHNLFKVNMFTIINSFQNKGIYSRDVMEEIFLPLFKDNDISTDVTMKEFYEITKIDIHIYASEVYSYVLTDFSHKTHPDMKLIDVVYCSCCIPIIFTPLLLEDKCYCDGAIILNYPIQQCLSKGIDPETILGLKMQVYNSEIITINKESSMFDYLLLLMSRLLSKRLLYMDVVDTKIAHEIVVKNPQLSIYGAYKVLSEMDERIRLVDYGKKCIEELFSIPTTI